MSFITGKRESKTTSQNHTSTLALGTGVHDTSAVLPAGRNRLEMTPPEEDERVEWCIGCEINTDAISHG
jgi:hypothetical protein